MQNGLTIRFSQLLSRVTRLSGRGKIATCGLGGVCVCVCVCVYGGVVGGGWGVWGWGWLWGVGVSGNDNLNPYEAFKKIYLTREGGCCNHHRFKITRVL